MTTIDRPDETLIDKFKEGNHLILGEAGSGKTELVRRIMQQSEDTVCLAPTAIACRNIADHSRGITAQTIQSFFRLSESSFALSRTPVSRYDELVYRKVRRIIIDDGHMVRQDTFDAIDGILRQAGNPREPFGGKQILLFGDFRQLPPIVDDLVTEFGEHYEGFWPFRAQAWSCANFDIHILQANFRQTDEEFKTFLHNMHEGIMDWEAVRKIRVCGDVNEIFFPTKETILLCANRMTALIFQALNRNRLQGKVYQLEGINETYPGWEYPTDLWLRLMTGCKVMLLRNDSANSNQGYAHGAIGTFLGMESDDTMLVQMDDGTTCKIQRETWTYREYKVVNDGSGARITQVPYGTFTQFPVRLAYAMKIHETQGLTLDRTYVCLEPDTCLTPGLLYTAFSRVRSFSDLTISRPLQENEPRLDSNVNWFYARINSQLA